MFKLGSIPPSFINNVSSVKDPLGRVPEVGIDTKSKGGKGCSLCEKITDTSKIILKQLSF